MKTGFFLTDEERDTIVLALENEIESNTDVLTQKLSKDERNAWKETILFQKNLMAYMKNPTETIISITGTKLNEVKNGETINNRAR